jgi:tRNA wybutosine-synthesizing protein 2
VSEPESTDLRVVIADRTAAPGRLLELHEQGILDDSRRVRAHGGTQLAIPVTTRPKTGRSRPDPAEPTMLRRRLRAHGWDDGPVGGVSRDWARVGSVIRWDVGTTAAPELVADQLLSLSEGAESVISGADTTGDEPRRSEQVLAGVGATETIHEEGSVRYAMDVAEARFRPGDAAERRHVARTIDPAERVYVPAAGIGGYCIPAAGAASTVIAEEADGSLFRYLLENVVLNDLTEQVDAYRAEPGDVALGEQLDRLLVTAPGLLERLPTLARSLAPGGIVHLHRATDIDSLADHLSTDQATELVGRPASRLTDRLLPCYRPGRLHLVSDFQVTARATASSGPAGSS